ncbi:DUF1656 domain-containing protein [Kosakonia oryziphila]|uniref:DUF1656 domain-containing protein n=1 Tax=Kosakonia oryziphila TaxID=1005667 RepID=A0A1C4D1Q3_9ENTR|nr:DUF1656 domain-containing protein [Kosakonia oryziphila]SCC25273.1 Protein of unknown function [Kosakonia oryziphila]
MINDMNIGGVFFPGLLVIAVLALVFTLLCVSLFSFNRFYLRLPYRPLMGFSIYIVTFSLFIQGLNALGLFA